MPVVASCAAPACPTASARGCARGHPLSESAGIPPITWSIILWPHGRGRENHRASQWSAQPAATSSLTLSKRGAPGSTTAVTGHRRHGAKTSASPAARTLPLAASTRTPEGHIAPRTALGGHMLRLAPASATQRPAATIPPSARYLAARLGGRAPPFTWRARRTTVAAGASGCRSPRATALAYKLRAHGYFFDFPSAFAARPGARVPDCAARDARISFVSSAKVLRIAPTLSTSCARPGETLGALGHDRCMCPRYPQL